MATLPRHMLALLLLALTLALTAGCSSKHSTTRYAAQGSNCYAKALPSSGEGGLAFGPTLATASRKSLDSCVRYASRSGGTPRTCQVVVAKCKG
ncbi:MULTISPECIES: hypothetical protein [unclassified Pseudomonas]|uniref:hypothetical protein n=1 Tax=unclassified Pseudomonas TaxID=196821 RepID=UPI002448E82A|nr:MULTISPECIES: hypothetical protein [unclassified Pseudomonas]MDH0301787.1 hypothetical protein [Pseudomonas sp. GD04091]MDH1983925.1 hypothetical protein [Pseudomonas sp. GD03689]